MLSISIENAIDCIKNFGLLKGLFLIFFICAHTWIYCLYNQRINDAKEQIKRIANENREYRERFLSLLDNRFDYKPKFNGPPVITQSKR
mgnify:CR=1 FL=1|jgi:hypothetical protein